MSNSAAPPPRTCDIGRPPSGLSNDARDRWTALQARYVFEVHEAAAFEDALRWQDMSRVLFREAKKLKGRERSARLKSAADAAVMSLKFFRTLRFVDPARPARGPGRPPGKPWPLAAVAAVRTLGDAHR